MGDIVLQKNIAALIDLKALNSSLSWTAGGASDSVTWTGLSIDRGGFGVGAGGLAATPMPYSMDAVLYYQATLQSGKTLAVTFDLQSSPDNATWTDFATQTTTTIATGPSGNGTVNGVVRVQIPNVNAPSNMPGIDLTNAQRYLRLNVLPHLSATGTDTAVIAAVGVFGGFDRLPAAAT